MNPVHKNSVERSYRIADGGIADGRVANTQTQHQRYWYKRRKWCGKFGIDPYLVDITHERKLCEVTGFAGVVRDGAAD